MHFYPHFLLSTMKLREQKLKPKDEAASYTSMCKDKDGFEVEYINADKGELILHGLGTHRELKCTVN